MNKEEIFRYIKLSNSKSVSISRQLLKEYPGIIMEIVIKANAKLQIDFLDENMLKIDEGEISLYFYYENYDKLFQAVEKFTKMKMEEWKNYTQIGGYPISKEYDLSKSWNNLKKDFSNKILKLPTGYIKFDIRDLYWTALYSGEVKVDDSWDKYEEWLRRKKNEEDSMYE